MRPTPDLSELMADGRWLAHRYDETSDEVQFRFAPRDAQREVTFLTDREIGDAPVSVHSRIDCLEEVRNQAPPVPRFIFHSAYCCSTLLARALDVPGVSFGLKEPQILNDVVGLQLRRGDPRQVAAAADVALALLARPLGAGEVNVIKPSNLVNPLIPLLTAMRPHMRGLFLYAPLEVFLGSIARKEIEGRTWVRELMWKLINLGQAQRFGFTNEELYRQTDLQVAALGWLSQQALFREVLQRNNGFRSLDSETLVTRPVDALKGLSHLFEIGFHAEEAASGPAFRTHSKNRSDYTSEQRVQDRKEGQDLHAREIGIVLDWSRALADEFDIPLALPSQLIA